MIDKVTRVIDSHCNESALKFIDMVQQERERQDKKWGEQTHSLTGWFAILGEEFGEFAKEVVELDCYRSPIASREDTIKELVEVAAVAQCIYEQYFVRDPNESKT